MMRTRKHCAALVLSMVVGTPVLACPTDLSTPVVVTWEDGTVSTISDVGNTTIQEKMASPEGDIDYFESYRGLIETAYRYQEKGASREPEVTRYSYDFPLDALFPLEKGKIKGGTQTARYEDGFEETSVVSLQPQDPTEVTIGECSYAARTVYQTFLKDGALSRVEFTYLPTLGFGLVVSYAGDGSVDRYTPISIAPLSPGAAQ